jgi:uncharacterized membrane protein
LKSQFALFAFLVDNISQGVIILPSIFYHYYPFQL